MAPVLRTAIDTQGDYHVMHGEWQIGQIDKRRSLTGPGDRWFWALNGIPVGIPRGMGLAGVAATLEEAQAALQKAWEDWMAWANLAPRTGDDPAG
jgi:hypothetical protein